MYLNNFPCISFTSHYIFKMATVTGCYEGSFIRNNLNFDQAYTKIVCVQMPVFSDTFTS